MPLTVLLFKICDTRMPDFEDRYPLHRPNGKRHSMVSLLSLGVMAGRSGRIGLPIRKGLMKRYRSMRIYAGVKADFVKPSANFRLLSRLSSFASTTHSIAAFASFLVFLLNGRYRTLTDRLLRLRLAPPMSQVSREVSFEYLNRQLVWHAFTEFLLFLLPLVGISRWRRWLSRGLRKAKALVRSTGSEDDDDLTAKGELAFLPERTCAICYHDQNPISTSENELMAVTGASGGVIGSAQTDVTNPYETIPCGCVYCFVCIATMLEGEEGEGWICLRCGELVKECKPWVGDVLEETSTPGAKKKVSFSGDEYKHDEQEKGHTIATETVTREGIVDHRPTDLINEKAKGLFSDGQAESREWARGESDGSENDAGASH